MSERSVAGASSAAAAQKVAGVLGGMGPEATVDFLARIVRATPARDDCDHIHVLIDCNPQVPSRIARLLEGHGEDPLPVLVAMAQGLKAQGADFLVIPCNTAHHYLPDIARTVGIPVLDMVSLAAVRLAQLHPQPTTVGVLSMPAVRKVGLYEARLAGEGMTAMFPEQAGEQVLLDVIRAVKAGAVTDAVRAGYAGVAAAHAGQGADALLIACTELSVLGSPAGCALPVIDALDALVEATVRTARAGR
jgi:aspartate racemase